jgi:hypothetical protein
VEIRTELLWADTKVSIYLDDDNTEEMIDILEKIDSSNRGMEDEEQVQQLRVPFTVVYGKAAKHAKRAMKGLKLAGRLRNAVISQLEENNHGCGVVLEIYMDGTRPRWVDVDPQ